MSVQRQPFIRLRSSIEKPLQRRGLLPVRREEFPRFLGIGAQKSGTTWLHANLSRHPSIFLPETKELHYFDWNFHRPLSEYLAHFKQAGARIRGEITPGYSVLDDDRVDFIRGVAPDLKVILLLRDPIERAWSQAVMNIVEIEGRPAGEIPDAAFLEHLADDRVRLRNDYLGIIDRWGGAFGPENIHVGFFEDVSERPIELLSGILEFLGVPDEEDADFSMAGKRVRPGIPVPMPESVREALVADNADGLRRLHQRFGAPVDAWMKRHGIGEVVS